MSPGKQLKANPSPNKDRNSARRSQRDKIVDLDAEEDDRLGLNSVRNGSNKSRFSKKDSNSKQKKNSKSIKKD
jgi:hypothetical protein